MSRRELKLKRSCWPEIHTEVREGFGAICKEFDLTGNLALDVLKVLEEVASL